MNTRDTFKIVLGNKNLSSWSLRPWLVLAKVGVVFDEQVIRLDTTNTKEQILNYSSAGKVPVLIHNDIRIWESLAICEYLADLFPEKNLWPKDIATRAYARSLSHEMHAGFVELRKNCPMDVTSRIDKVLSVEVLADIARIQNIWTEALNRSGGPYLFKEFTIADAMFAPVVTRFQTYNISVSSLIQKYMNTILEMPEMQRWFKDAENEVRHPIETT